MRKAHFPANLVDLFVGNMPYAGRERFDAKRGDFVLAQPACRLRAQTGATVPILGAESAAVMIGVEQEGFARPDFETGQGQGAFQVGNLNQLMQAFGGEIEAEACGVEHRQRHGLDRLAAELAAHVVEGIHVRPGMFAQFQPVDGG